jgi:hypothetical protein
MYVCIYLSAGTDGPNFKFSSYVCMCVYVCMHACTHACMYIHADKHTHTHTVNRSRAIFDWIFSIPAKTSSTAKECEHQSESYSLGYIGVSDDGISMVERRTEREIKSLLKVQKVRICMYVCMFVCMC